MEALGTQLAGHFQVRALGLDSGVWRWYGNQQAPSQCRGIGDGFRSGRLGLPQVTDRKLNPSCYQSSAVPSVHLNSRFLKLSCFQGEEILKTWYSLKRLASQEGTGHGDSHKLEEQGWKRHGTIPLVWMSHLTCGVSPFPERPYLDSFTSTDMDVAGHQETDWTTFFSVCFSLPFVGLSISPVCLCPGMPACFQFCR